MGLIEIIAAWPTGYQLWWAEARTADGRTFLGGGLSREAAEYRARVKAQENLK